MTVAMALNKYGSRQAGLYAYDAMSGMAPSAAPTLTMK